MSDKKWEPVKMDWANDVGIVGELNIGMARMNESADLDELIIVHRDQRGNADYLTGDGRAKWEKAYAVNVLRHLNDRDPPKTGTNQIILITSESDRTGRFSVSDCSTYDTPEQAVMDALCTLHDTGDLITLITPGGRKRLKGLATATPFDPDAVLKCLNEVVKRVRYVMYDTSKFTEMVEPDLSRINWGL